MTISNNPKSPHSLHELSYSERQLIVVVDDNPVKVDTEPPIELPNTDYMKLFMNIATIGFKLTSPPLFLASALTPVVIELIKSLNKLKDQGINTVAVSRSEAKQLNFPPGHPRNGVLYVAHPVSSDKYFPISQFHRVVFEHKFSEAIRLLMSLGAKKIMVEHITGWSKEFCAQLNTSIPQADIQTSASFRQNSKSGSALLFQANLRGNQKPILPDNLVWYHHEPTWQQIAEGRLLFGLDNFSLSVRYDDDYGINAGLRLAASKAGLDLGGKFEDHQLTVWKIIGDFN